MRKKILASLLALVVLATPATVLANQQVNVNTADVLTAITLIGRHIEVVDGQPQIPLRVAVEAFEGTSIDFDGATRIVEIRFNSTIAVNGFNAFFNTEVAIPASGNFVVRLQHEMGSNFLTIVDGPAAGTRILANLTPEGRFVLPLPGFQRDISLADLPATVNSIANHPLVAASVIALTGAAGFTHEITAEGISVTLN